MRCWKCSETPEEPRCTRWGPIGASGFPQRALWGCLSAAVLIIIAVALVALIVAGKLPLHPGTQVGRVLAPGRPAALINQSASVDRRNSVVTFSIASHANHTSTVLFDVKHGLICYKPDNKGSCYLQRMETSDYENVHVLLNASDQQVNPIWVVRNETRGHTEFLGVLSGNRVDATTLQQPLRALCKPGHVYWTKKADGPKERLIYFCIDICFPNNICVSVCFYYLPE